MVIVGLLLTAVLIGGGVVFVAHVIEKAREAGALTSTPKTGSRKARAKTTVRHAPQNVRTIFAQAWADNWVAKRTHRRTLEADAAKAGRGAAGSPAKSPVPPKPTRRPLMERLVGPPTVAPATAATVPAGANGHSPELSPRSRLAAVPDPSPGRTPPMASAPPAAAPTGAAADMFSAANVLNAHARAGGIHAKLRTEKVYKEALEHVAKALEAFAKDMQESGRYPALVWEPVMTAATHVRAGSLAMGEAENALTALMRMPLGEVAASPIQAPHHDELNRA